MSGDEETIIRDYIVFYNNFNIEGMLSLMHPELEYIGLMKGIEDVIDGKVQIIDKNTLSISKDYQSYGISEFRKLYERGDEQFEVRNLKIISIWHLSQQVDVEYNLTATFKAGQYPEEYNISNQMETNGKYIFQFKDGLIWKFYVMYE